MANPSISSHVPSLHAPTGAPCSGITGIHPLVDIYSLLMCINLTALTSAWGRREENRDEDGGKGAAQNSEWLFAQTTALVRVSCNFNITSSALVRTKHFSLKKTFFFFFLAAIAAILKFWKLGVRKTFLKNWAMCWREGGGRV